jgi:hypothetical protein
VHYGEIIEEQIWCTHVGEYGVRDYFEDLKEAHRSLKLVPGVGRITMEAWDLEDREEEIKRRM